MSVSCRISSQDRPPEDFCDEAVERCGYVVFQVSRRKIAIFGVIALLVGVAETALGTTLLVKWVNGARLDRTAIRAVLSLPVGPIVAASGVYLAIRSPSRPATLEITPTRVTVRNFRSERWAEWSSVGTFAPLKRVVVARVSGPAASPDVIKSGKLEIYARRFDLEPHLLATQLNDVRKSAVDGQAGSFRTTPPLP